MGLNLDHALAIKRAPCAFTFLTCHCKITAADDVGLLQGVASAFDFLRIARVELQAAEAAIKLGELNGNDAGLSVVDEALNDVGFGLGLKHGWEANGRLAPRERRIHGKGPVSRACNKSLQNQLAQLLH